MSDRNAPGVSYNLRLHCKKLHERYFNVSVTILDQCSRKLWTVFQLDGLYFNQRFFVAYYLYGAVLDPRNTDGCYLARCRKNLEVVVLLWVVGSSSG